jgi:hypothetical protein
MNAHEWKAQVDFEFSMSFTINATVEDEYSKYDFSINGNLNPETFVKGMQDIGKPTMVCGQSMNFDPTTFGKNYALRAGYGCLDRWNLTGSLEHRTLTYNGYLMVTDKETGEAETYIYSSIGTGDENIPSYTLTANWSIFRRVPYDGGVYLIDAPYQKGQLPAWDTEDPFYNGYKTYYDHFVWRVFVSVELENPYPGEGGPGSGTPFSVSSTLNDEAPLYYLGSTECDLSLYAFGLSDPDAGSASITTSCSKL